MKTKKELLEEIEQINAEIDDLKEEIKRLEKYKKYDETAEDIKAIYDSFVRSGFTEEQAFKLLNTMSAAAMRPKLF